MIRYLDKEEFLDISLFLKNCYFWGFYTNCHSLYHELENTLYKVTSYNDNNIIFIRIEQIAQEYCRRNMRYLQNSTNCVCPRTAFVLLVLQLNKNIHFVIIYKLNHLLVG